MLAAKNTLAPPPHLMARVTGSEDDDWFRTSGVRTLEDWDRALAAIGRASGDFQDIVDFGCGCGRVMLHLRERLTGGQTLTGVDVDGEAIDWLNASLGTEDGGVRGVTLDPMPPSPLAPESVDLVLNQSVFTHLPEDVQFAWLADAARILRPGGIAVLTTHGRTAWANYVKNLRLADRAEEADRLSARWQRRGFDYVSAKTVYEECLPEYYGAAFHTTAYVEAEWARWFAVKAWLPAGSLDYQDIWVLEKS